MCQLGWPMVPIVSVSMKAFLCYIFFFFKNLGCAGSSLGHAGFLRERALEL